MQDKPPLGIEGPVATQLAADLEQAEYSLAAHLEQAEYSPWSDSSGF